MGANGIHLGGWREFVGTVSQAILDWGFPLGCSVSDAKTAANFPLNAKIYNKVVD